MFSGGNNLSLADIAAVTDGNRNGNGMFGEGWWVIIIFALIFGWGNGGWGGFGGNGNGVQGALTRADLCADMNFQSLENAVRGIQQGLCDGFYAQNTNLLNGFSNLQNTVQAGFAGVDNAVCTLGYQTQQGFNSTNLAMMQAQNALQSQIAQCCCDNRVGQMQLGNTIESGFCNANYNAATNTTAIIQNAHNDTDRVLAKLDAMEMSRKDETIADLRAKLAACGDQTTAQYIINQLSNIISPTAVPAYPAASPCGLGNWNPQVLQNGWGNGCNSCGCNGCGC